MTEPIEIVRLREQIAHELWAISYKAEGEIPVMTLEEFAKKGGYKQFWLEQADQILALTKPDGTKAIGVIADEQELPDTWRDDTPEKAQRDMLNTGWKKVKVE